jgi:uncharacterized membrane protein YphA (DoxX/SURF4 family)
MNKLFSSSPIWQTGGLALVRIITGFFMIYHGWEVFDKAKMDDYANWESFQSFSSANLMAYLGKAAELCSGLLLLIGLFTRLGALMLIITMLYISFIIGQGRVWYEEQHPFLFVLLGLIFFFTGGGKYSLDNMIFKNGRTNGGITP